MYHKTAPAWALVCCLALPACAGGRKIEEYPRLPSSTRMLYGGGTPLQEVPLTNASLEQARCLSSIWQHASEMGPFGRADIEVTSLFVNGSPAWVVLALRQDDSGRLISVREDRQGFRRTYRADCLEHYVLEEAGLRLTPVRGGFDNIELELFEGLSWVLVAKLPNRNTINTASLQKVDIVATIIPDGSGWILAKEGANE